MILVIFPNIYWLKKNRYLLSLFEKLHFETRCSFVREGSCKIQPSIGSVTTPRHIMIYYIVNSRYDLFSLATQNITACRRPWCLTAPDWLPPAWFATANKTNLLHIFPGTISGPASPVGNVYLRRACSRLWVLPRRSPNNWFPLNSQGLFSTVWNWWKVVRAFMWGQSMHRFQLFLSRINCRNTLARYFGNFSTSLSRTKLWS